MSAGFVSLGYKDISTGSYGLSCILKGLDLAEGRGTSILSPL